uniref:Uncharacterized protein n=1 Tax=Arundo donax TaxID=35708 RepID=A0A0A9CI41_ARUDO
MLHCWQLGIRDTLLNKTRDQSLILICMNHLRIIEYRVCLRKLSSFLFFPRDHDCREVRSEGDQGAIYLCTTKTVTWTIQESLESHIFCA